MKRIRTLRALVALVVLAAPLLAARSGSPGVTWLPANQVADAFRRGMPLVETQGYKVHASRREGPGQAEIHEKDTDIVYVLEGTATLVTGGEVEDGRRTAPEELRGDAIAGGAPRDLSPGDVVIIPAGTPHWFRQVSAPFTYYVVKVRS
jgi:quercetin dioxygenase-like cupin family protein